MINIVANEVFETKEYSQFKTLKGNRELNLLHLGRLKISIEAKQLMIPIIVNEKLEVIDGQHRLQIFKELDLPVYFIIGQGYGLSECQIMNAENRVWKPEDFLKGYSDLGYIDYIKLGEFKEKYTFLSIKLCQILLSGGQVVRYISQSFKEGTFKIKDYESACKIANKMIDFKNYEPFRQYNFLLALNTMFSNKQYKHERILQKLAYQGNRLVKEVSVNEYLKTLTAIYNYRMSTNDKVYFYQRG